MFHLKSPNLVKSFSVQSENVLRSEILKKSPLQKPIYRSKRTFSFSPRNSLKICTKSEKKKLIRGGDVPVYKV